MSITALGHLYVETQQWEQSAAFWTGPGFSFIERWGSEGHRAGRLDSEGVAVVLAAIGAEQTPAFSVFLALDDPDGYSVSDDVEVVAPLEGTHWGTRRMQVRDPDGRVYSLESSGARE